MGTDRVQTRLLRVLPARRLQRHWVDLFDAAIEMGCTAFDTASSYRGGDAERLLGRWSADAGVRDQIIVVTKGGMPRAGRSTMTPAVIAEDLETSLRRLRRDYVDLYLLHRDDPLADVPALLEALASHRRAGKIRAYGLSNWEIPRVAMAVAEARTRDLPPPSAVSVQLSLASWQAAPFPGLTSLSGSTPEARSGRSWLATRDLALLAYSPLARGFLTRSGSVASAARRGADARWQAAYDLPANFARLDRARELARIRGVSPPEIALAYVLSQGPNIFAVVGVKDPGKLGACVGACRLTLSEDEVRWLEGAAPQPGSV